MHRFREIAATRARENRAFLNKLKKGNPRALDDAFHETHEEVFKETNCMECANCCKTTSPIFYQADIERLSKIMRMKPGDFIEKYLRVDEDKDFVLQTAPCPFLNDDNSCSVYEVRPKACREYPHTHRKKMVQILDLTHRNSLVCPAVLEIVERLKKLLP